MQTAKGSDLRIALLDASLAIAAEQGGEGVSLRAVAAKAGRSTTAIFQHFGGKEGLLDATLDHAVARSGERHAALARKLAGMPQEAAALRGAVAFYVLQECRDPANLFCLGALFQREDFSAAVPGLRAWDAARRTFWESVLGAGPFAPLAEVIVDYTATEQGFAAALHGEPAYNLLLHETLAGLFASDTGDAPAIAWAEQQAFPEENRPAPTAAMEALLDSAARVVIEDGPAGLNPRRLATEAGITPSLIVYHYGDFAAFNRAAVWRAIMHGLPHYLDVNQSGMAAGPHGQAWLSELAQATRAGDTQHPAGFYVRYARTLGQLGLLAPRNPEFLPLLLQLRAIEGVGIQQASRSQWPPAFRLSRSVSAGFAIWMKGRAILNAGLEGHVSDDRSERDILATLERMTSPRAGLSYRTGVM